MKQRGLFHAIAFIFITSITHGQSISKLVTTHANEFIESLTTTQKNEALVSFDSPLRYDWNYTPRPRKGLTFHHLDTTQKSKAFKLVSSLLSQEGIKKVYQIIDLENVLRVLENRSSNDTYRDPENYSFLFYGNPNDAQWSWRLEGHHLSLQFYIKENEVRFTPGFMGSNPARVLIDVPQKGTEVLREEFLYAIELLNMFDPTQKQKAILGTKAPNEIFTANARRAILDKKEGIPYKDLSSAQKKAFKKLIDVYLNRYHVTLKKQQWKHLAEKGLNEIYFAWMGDTTYEYGTNLGQYYRIHGPTLLIEFDNTQNNGNHVHSVVRDLENDFGDDLLGLHYQKDH